MFFKRLAFLEFLESMLKASSGQHAEEVRDKIFPKMLRHADFIQHFCPIRSAAAAGDSEEIVITAVLDPLSEAAQRAAPVAMRVSVDNVPYNVD